MHLTHIHYKCSSYMVSSQSSSLCFLVCMVLFINRIIAYCNGKFHRTVVIQVLCLLHMVSILIYINKMYVSTWPGHLSNVTNICTAVRPRAPLAASPLFTCSPAWFTSDEWYCWQAINGCTGQFVFILNNIVLHSDNMNMQLKPFLVICMDHVPQFDINSW